MDVSFQPHTALTSALKTLTLDPQPLQPLLPIRILFALIPEKRCVILVIYPRIRACRERDRHIKMIELYRVHVIRESHEVSHVVDLDFGLSEVQGERHRWEEGEMG